MVSGGRGGGACGGRCNPGVSPPERGCGGGRTLGLAAMSHELRTPLNAILGFSHFLRSEAFGPLGSLRYKDDAQDIHRSTEGLLPCAPAVLKLRHPQIGERRTSSGTLKSDMRESGRFCEARPHAGSGRSFENLPINAG